MLIHIFISLGIMSKSAIIGLHGSCMLSYFKKLNCFLEAACFIFLSAMFELLSILTNIWYCR